MDPLTVTCIQGLLAEASVDDLPALLRAHCRDARPGVTTALQRATRRLERELAERARLEALCAWEWALVDRGVAYVAGVDEVGRGALAGPVSAGACIFPRDVMLSGLNDSKQLTAVARERLHVEIAKTAIAVAVGHAEPAEIDRVGIGPAIVLAMRRALDALGMEVGHVLVDGRHVELGHPTTAIVKGDTSVRAIAAAAVFAKVTRDRLMAELSAEYPGYGFDHNKGYGSSDHLDAIAALGPSPIHRMSFAPCCQRSLFD